MLAARATARACTAIIALDIIAFGAAIVIMIDVARAEARRMERRDLRHKGLPFDFVKSAIILEAVGTLRKQRTPGPLTNR